MSQDRRVLNIGVGGAGDGHFSRRRRTEVENLADEISRIEGELRVRKLLWQSLSKLLFEAGQRKRRVGLQADVDDCLLRSTGPQEDSIDWIRRTLSSDVAKREIKILGARLPCDGYKHFLNKGFGHRHSCTIWSINAQPELLRCRRRKNLLGNSRSKQNKNQHGDQCVGTQEERREFHHPLQS